MVGMTNIGANYTNILNVIGCTSATTKINNFPKSTLFIIVRIFSRLSICAQIWKENKFSVESYSLMFTSRVAYRVGVPAAPARTKEPTS